MQSLKGGPVCTNGDSMQPAEVSTCNTMTLFIKGDSVIVLPVIVCKDMFDNVVVRWQETTGRSLNVLMSETVTRGSVLPG